jgi:hypothetical protein
MSGIYVPGAFSKKKLTVEIPEVIPSEEKKIDLELSKQDNPIISEVKPAEVKQSVWGGKKSFVECLKTNSSVAQAKEEPIIAKKNNTPVYVQKEIRKEEFDSFMEKYDCKLKKLYEKSIYYDKDFFNKLRINGDQGYMTFCKFMFHLV